MSNRVISYIVTGEDLFSPKMAGVAARMQSIGKAMTKYVTLPVAAVGAASVKLAVDFNGSMNKINALVGISQKQVSAWSGQVLDLARKLPQSPKELADALYYVTSAGFRGAEAMNVLTISGKAAAAGLGDTKTVANAVTSALNAYHMSGQKASSVTDTLVAAVTQGKMPADELAGAIGQVLPVAAEMGVSFQEVAGTAAALSRSGANVRRTMTGLRFLLSSLENPASKSAKILDAVGISADDIRKSIADKGLLATLTMLKKRLPLPDFLKVVGGARGVVTALGLVGKNSKQVADVLAKVQGATGATDRAFKSASKTAGFKFSAALSSLQATAIQVGSKLAPPLAAIAGQFAKVADWFGKLSPGAQEWAIKLALVAAAIGPVLLLSAKLIAIAKLVAAGFGAIKFAIFAVRYAMATADIAALGAAPWLALAAAVAVAAVLIIKNWGTVKRWFETAWNATVHGLVAAWNWVKDAVVGAFRFVYDGVGKYMLPALGPIGLFALAAIEIVKHWSAIVGFFTRIRNFIARNFTKWWAQNGDAVKRIWSGIWTVVSAVFTFAWRTISVAAQVYWKVLTTVFRVGAAVVRGAWSLLWNRVLTIYRVASAIVTGVAKAWWIVLKTVFSIGASAVRAVWKSLWAIATAIVKNAWLAVRTVLKIGWDLIVGMFSVFINLITGRWGAAWRSLRDMFRQIWNAMRDFLGGALRNIWNAIRTTFGNVLGFFRNLPGKIMGAVGNLRKLLVEKGKDVIRGLWEGLTFIWRKVTGWISGLARWIKNHKGPISLDRRLLEPAGRALMEGLGVGLRSGFVKVKDIVTGAAGTIGGWVKGGASTVGNVFAGLLGLGGGGSPKGKIGGTYGVDYNYLSALKMAMILTQTPQRWLSGLIQLVNRESGGDAKARNPIAVMGQHASGLLQMLPATFRAYMMKGFGNIWNAVDNSVASIRYIKDRYRSVYNIPNLYSPAYVGYAQGTRSAKPGWAWVGEGGVPELVRFRGGEQVGPVAAARTSGGNTYVIKVYPSPLASPADTGREVVGAIRAFESRNGKGWRS